MYGSVTCTRSTLAPPGTLSGVGTVGADPVVTGAGISSVCVEPGTGTVAVRGLSSATADAASAGADAALAGVEAAGSAATGASPACAPAHARAQASHATTRRSGMDVSETARTPLIGYCTYPSPDP